jgi:predicted glycogen debranching enzyme
MRRVLAAPLPADTLLGTEWLVTNGLGGYAGGTLGGAATRRYHGLLVAALPPPLGRVMMLNHVADTVVLPDGRELRLGALAPGDARAAESTVAPLAAVGLDGGLPYWRFAIGPFVLERRIWMAHGANTSYTRYRVLSGDGALTLTLVPGLAFRGHDDPVSNEHGDPVRLTVTGAAEDRFEFSAASGPFPPLRLRLDGPPSRFTIEARPTRHVLYRIEEDRGYPAAGTLFEPGRFTVTLAAGQEATLLASTEPWLTIDALAPAAALAAEEARRLRLLAAADADPAKDAFAADLVLAADAFVITPVGRARAEARAHAVGDEVRTVIAGYHWFTDWGRDTMIALEGLTLATGRAREAADILRTFALYVRDGLIPNYFPDRQSEGVYHTADATLWFFHAIERYRAATSDDALVTELLPTLRSILERHLAGTRFGIGVDPTDGLLRQGTPDLPLTWMDAKMGDFIPTPRRGKAVEINALWYNALRLCAEWTRARGDAAVAATLAGHAERAQASFARRFWCAERGWLYDVVDGPAGDDATLRPNQIFAVALPHPVLAQARWAPVVEVVRRALLTPAGLRSLAPDDPAYQPRYFGDLKARDAAYHQGTVWSWLIGPFIDAWLRVHPDDANGARRLLGGFADHAHEACLGTVAEIFDGEAPFTPRGCVAQAWGVAEVLRAWRRTAPR